jgi:hypothetical protein
MEMGNGRIDLSIIGGTQEMRIAGTCRHDYCANLGTLELDCSGPAREHIRFAYINFTVV